jgi:metal-sulfur cluster biosynthetic enzyme
MPTDNKPLLSQIQRAVSKVPDPELGIPIVELDLIDKLDVTDEGAVTVEYRATTPYCPAAFAFKISRDIKDEILKIDGVKDVKVVVLEHYMADMINRAVALNAAFE